MKMRKKIQIILLMLSICCMPEICGKAEGLKDENPYRIQEVTEIDEDGMIHIVDSDVDGKVEPSKGRAIGGKVVNFNTKSIRQNTTYTEIGTGKSGYTNGRYGADAAYLGTDEGKVKFMLGGVVGLVDSKEVEVVDISAVKSLSYYYVEGGKLKHRIATNLNSPGAGSTLNNGPAPSYLKTGVNYYSYDGHYFYTDYDVMLADYEKNSRSKAVNAETPFYNYFQYLPLRSKTSYTSAEINKVIEKKSAVYEKNDVASKMKDKGVYFINRQNEYGVNALIMIGLAANESAWGTSSISQSKNNLFGLNAIDEAPGASADVFSTVSQCIKEFAETWMSKGYLDPSDSRYFGGFLGDKASGMNVKYASDPYWGEKAAHFAWDIDSSISGKDQYKYSIGIKDTLATEHNNVNVRRENSTSAASLYMTGHASNYAVLLYETTAQENFYKIQSDGVLNAKRTGLDTSTGIYNFAKMYAHISKDYVTIVNKGGKVDTTQKLEPEKPEMPNIPDKPSSSIWVEYDPERYGDTKENVNMHISASTNDDVLQVLPKGIRILLQGCEKTSTGSWYKTTYKNQTGYVSADYVSLSYQKYLPTKIGKTTANMYMRSEVGLNYEKKEYIPSGSKLTLHGHYRTKGYDWYHISYNGKIGYVSSKYVEVEETVKPSEPPKFEGTWVEYKPDRYGDVEEKVNIRKGPGTEYDSIDKVEKGKRILLQGYQKTSSGSWYKTTYGGKEGYISADYVKLSFQPYSPYKMGKTTANMYMRSGVGLSYAKKNYIKSGSQLTLYGYYRTDGCDWYYVEHSGVKGYVSSKYVTRLNKTTTWIDYNPERYGDVQENSRFRRGAGTEFSIITSIPKGTRLLLQGYEKTSSGSWYRTTYKGEIGYISADYTKLSYRAYNPDKMGKTTANMYMRSGVGLDYTKKTYIPSGSEVILYGYYRTEGYDWYYVKYKNLKGYISSKYVNRL